MARRDPAEQPFGQATWKRPTNDRARSLREAQERASYDHTPATGAGCGVLLLTCLAMTLAILTGLGATG